MILDTNALSALFNGDPVLSRVLSGSSRHHLPVMVLGEYRFGLKRSRHRSKLEGLLEQLENESEILVPDVRTAHVYAEVREQLRLQGTPIPENDLWIAAMAIQHHQGVVSRDEHFDQVKRIERILW